MTGEPSLVEVAGEFEGAGKLKSLFQILNIRYEICLYNSLLKGAGLLVCPDHPASIAPK